MRKVRRGMPIEGKKSRRDDRVQEDVEPVEVD